MKRRRQLVFLLVCLSGFVGCSPSTYIEVTCPGEHVATRLPRDPASTYGHYARMYESGYRAAQSCLGSLTNRFSPSDTLLHEAGDFTKYLTGERSAVEARMEQAVARLQADPCDDKARADFQFLIQYVNFNGSYLHRIAAACRDSSANLRTMLEDYRRERN